MSGKVSRKRENGDSAKHDVLVDEYILSCDYSCISS
jgi:hypothetical protein